MSRCRNPKNISFINYGERGIEFKFKSFGEFIAAVGKKTDPSFMLDRINNDGHYERGNVRWVPRSINMLNSRTRRDNQSYGVRGVNWHGQGWAARFQDKWLGTFETPEKASEAYWQHRNEYERSMGVKN